MTKKEALQNLAYYQSKLFIQKEREFDKSILSIPYHELLADSLLGEQKQVYLTRQGHKIYQLMEWRANLDKLVKSCRKIADSQNWAFWKNRFESTFSSLSQEAQDFIDKNYL